MAKKADPVDVLALENVAGGQASWVDVLPADLADPNKDFFGNSRTPLAVPDPSSVYATQPSVYATIIDFGNVRVDAVNDGFSYRGQATSYGSYGDRALDLLLEPRFE